MTQNSAVLNLILSTLPQIAALYQKVYCNKYRLLSKLQIYEKILEFVFNYNSHIYSALIESLYPITEQQSPLTES